MVARLEETWDSAGIPMGRSDRSEDAVCLAYVPDAAAGDHVLVHLGFALEVLAPDAALEAIEARRELGTA
jgi:hydrogenase expression/formation protein HypC